MRRKVLILTTSIAGGGAERNAALLSRHLDADVTLGVYESRSDSFPHGGTLLDLKFTRTRGILAKACNYVTRVHMLNRLKVRLGVDATISLLDPPNLMNLLSGGRGKTIVSIRNYRSHKDREARNPVTKIENLLLFLLYNRADKVVVVSRAMADDMIANYGVRRDKIRVIYNSCDIEAISAAAEEGLQLHLDAMFREPVLITVGKLRNQKGQWHLIRAFRRVKQVVPNARLVILGRGELLGYLQGLAEESGLSTYTSKHLAADLPTEGYDVFFLGHQANPFKFLRNATVFTLPSLYEGFPNVLLEAMACGLPVLASDCHSGPREILAPRVRLEPTIQYPFQGDFGILLPTPNGEHYMAREALVYEESVWADAIIDLLQDNTKQTAYHKQSLQRVAGFDVRQVMREWEQLIDEGME